MLLFLDPAMRINGKSISKCLSIVELERRYVLDAVSVEILLLIVQIRVASKPELWAF